MGQGLLCELYLKTPVDAPPNLIGKANKFVRQAKPGGSTADLTNSTLQLN
jgi:hypothetical protein